MVTLMVTMLIVKVHTNGCAHFDNGIDERTVHGELERFVPLQIALCTGQAAQDTFI